MLGMVGDVGDRSRAGVLGGVDACARGLGVGVQGRDCGRREAAAERLVQDDLDLVLLVEQGVLVAAVALLDPALAGLVVERPVHLAPAFFAAQVLEAGGFLRVAEGVLVSDARRAAAVRRRAAARGVRLLEWGEDLDLLDAVSAPEAGADLDEVGDVAVVVLLGEVLVVLVTLDDRSVCDGARRPGPRVERGAVAAVLARLVGGVVPEEVDDLAVGGEGVEGLLRRREVQAQAALRADDEVGGVDRRGSGAVGEDRDPAVGEGLRTLAHGAPPAYRLPSIAHCCYAT